MQAIVWILTISKFQLTSAIVQYIGQEIYALPLNLHTLLIFVEVWIVWLLILILFAILTLFPDISFAPTPLRTNKGNQNPNIEVEYND